MEFGKLLEIVGEEPVFETGLLLCGNVDTKDIRRQLSRWVKGGRIVQLRRGLYVLAPPYRRIEPHPFVVANRLVVPSYVSLQSALGFHGLIPEGVPATVSVTTKRPGRRSTDLGEFAFRHLKVEMFSGYTRMDVGYGQKAFVATAEKALIDLVHLHPQSDAPGYLAGLRLQNMDKLDLAELERLAFKSSKPKLQRAVTAVRDLAEQEAGEYQAL
jgi:predicted transcriptional regulator of viral defense system